MPKLIFNLPDGTGDWLLPRNTSSSCKDFFNIIFRTLIYQDKEIPCVQGMAENPINDFLKAQINLLPANLIDKIANFADEKQH